MWRACSLVLAACGFEHGRVPRDASTDRDAPDVATCATITPAWWNAAFKTRTRITTNAPAGYTVRVDAREVFAAGGDVRVVVDTSEIDRVLDPPAVAFKAPASGTIWLYTTSGTPKPNADSVYLFSESFETIGVGTNANIRFVPDPATWTVADDGGNRVYRASGTGRHGASIRDLAVTDAEIAARMRIGATGGNNHDGLIVRANSMAAATMDGFVGQVLENEDRRRLAEYINGAVPVEVAQATGAVDRLQWYALRLRVVGDQLTFHVDDELIATSARPGSDGQLTGLFSYNCDVDFDDVRVRAVSDPEPTTTLGALEMCD